MIKSEHEYKEAYGRLERDKEIIAQHRQALEQANLTQEQIDRAMQPMLSFQAQLEEEVHWYEDVRNQQIQDFSNFTQIGRMLIALRISQGLTQRALAERLGINESVVSRDERDEYYGVSVEKVQRVIDALNASVCIHVELKERAVGETDPCLVC
jgi:DNA-directed RNA polymerase specialized sigma subunit